MRRKKEHPLNRKYRQTAFDRRAKRMTVYDFTRPMTSEERTTLFATVRQAICRAIAHSNSQSTVGPVVQRDPSMRETWWQFLRHNRQKYKPIL